MEKHKRRAEEFKREVVDIYLSKTMTPDQIAQKYSIDKKNIYIWLKKFGEQPLKLGRGADHKQAQERILAVEAYIKSGLSQKDFSKTWGVSEVSLSRWHSQYQKHGPKGLDGAIFNETHAKYKKKPGPKGISQELKKIITETKIANPIFGLRKVKNFLHRFNGLKVSTGAIRKTLTEENIPPNEVVKKKKRSSDKIRRFERARPMQLWQTDITSFVLTRHSQRVYFTVFMDDCSRYIVAWNLNQRQTSEFVIETLLNGVQKFGKPEEVLSDQGRQYFAWRGKSEFKKILDREGIKHVVARSHHPQTVGKCERFWETFGQEFWERVKPQELSDARVRIEKFINHYNHFRPHQGLDGMVPADRFFDVESQVRKALEETIEKNSLRLALDEAPRNPVFLIGQIGNQSVSLHGESGRLVIQTPEGKVKEFDYETFGSQERRDSGKDSGDNIEETRTQEKLRNQDAGEASASSENTLETSERGSEEESAGDRDWSDGSLDGKEFEDGNCEEIEHSTSENLAIVTTSSLGNVGGTFDTTKNTNERNNDERKRSEEITKENCGAGENDIDARQINSSSENDAWMLESANSIGGQGCQNQKDITKDSDSQWEEYWEKKNENEEK
jgi:transposase InsO family protein/transposase-like protein